MYYDFYKNKIKCEMEYSIRTFYKCSHPRCSLKKAVFKNLIIFTGKQLCWRLFLIKAFRPATSLKRDSNTSVFL